MPSDRELLTTLANDLRRLGLNRTADELNDIIAQAARKRWSATVLLEHIVAAELEENSAAASRAASSAPGSDASNRSPTGIGTGPARWTGPLSNASSRSTFSTAART